jgi:hypothetical protein
MSEGHVDPTREQFNRFKGLARGGPIHMLNLVRLRDHAVYEDGRQASGEEAYRAYARESGPVFRLEAIVRKRSVSIAQLARDPQLSANRILGRAESHIVAA